MARVVTNPTVSVVAGSSPTHSFNAPMVSNGSVLPTSGLVTVATLSVSTVNERDMKSLPFMVTIVVAMVVVNFLAVALNSLAIVAFAIHPNLRGYSDWFICNLAVADLCVGLVSMPLFIPNEVAGYWTFSHGVCLFWMTWDYTTTCASNLCITIIALDRYFLVKHPVQYLKWKRRRSLLVFMLAAPWVFCSLLYVLTIPIWDGFGVDTHRLDKDKCVLPYIDHYPMAFFTAAVEFFIPVTVLIIFNTLIFIELQKRKQRRKSEKPINIPLVLLSSKLLKSPTTDNTLSPNCSSPTLRLGTHAVSLAGSRDPQTPKVAESVIVHYNAKASTDQHDFIADEQTKLQTSRLRSHCLDPFPHPDTNRIGESSTSTQLEIIKSASSPAASNSRETKTCLSPRDEHIEAIVPDVQTGDARFEQLVESLEDQKDSVVSPTLSSSTSGAPIKLTWSAIKIVSRAIHRNRAEQQSITESPSRFDLHPNTSKASRDAGRPVFRSDLSLAAGMECPPMTQSSGVDLGFDHLLLKFTTKCSRASDVRNRKALRSLFIMIAVCVACWCPFEIVIMYMTVTGNTLEKQTHIHSFVRWLLWINSTINPVLYPLLYKRYRIAYIDTLRKLKRWKS